MGEGVGDLSIKASCRLVFKIFSIIDAWEYVSTAQWYCSSTTVTFKKLYDLSSSLTNYEVTAKLKSSAATAFALCLKRDNNQSNSYYVRLGADSSKLESAILLTSQTTQKGSTSYANDWHNIRFKFEEGIITTYIDDIQYQSSNLGFTPNYISYLSWNSTKTIYLEDLIIKPL